jgi:hypothetical protein
MTRKKTKQPTPEQLRAWKAARVANYVETRSALALAQMVVELEVLTSTTPEFEIDDAWPPRVAHMRVK